MNNANVLPTTTIAADQELISMFAEEEVTYWATKWGVTKESVKSAVKFSGSNSVSRVYAYLESRKKLRMS